MLSTPWLIFLTLFPLTTVIILNKPEGGWNLIDGQNHIQLFLSVPFANIRQYFLEAASPIDPFENIVTLPEVLINKTRMEASTHQSARILPIFQLPRLDGEFQSPKNATHDRIPRMTPPTVDGLVLVSLVAVFASFCMVFKLLRLSLFVQHGPNDIPLPGTFRPHALPENDYNLRQYKVCVICIFDEIVSSWPPVSSSLRIVLPWTPPGITSYPWNLLASDHEESIDVHTGTCCSIGPGPLVWDGWKGPGFPALVVWSGLPTYYERDAQEHTEAEEPHDGVVRVVRDLHGTVDPEPTPTPEEEDLFAIWIRWMDMHERELNIPTGQATHPIVPPVPPIPTLATEINLQLLENIFGM